MYHRMYSLNSSMSKSSRSFIMSVRYSMIVKRRPVWSHFIQHALNAHLAWKCTLLTWPFLETGHPLIATQEKVVLLYWLKIKTTPLRIVHKELYRFSNAKHITWCTYVRDLLISIGLGNIWMGQDKEISAENVDQLKLLFYYLRKTLKAFIPEAGYRKSSIYKSTPFSEPTPCSNKNNV